MNIILKFADKIVKSSASFDSSASRNTEVQSINEHTFHVQELNAEFSLNDHHGEISVMTSESEQQVSSIADQSTGTFSTRLGSESESPITYTVKDDP